MACDATDDAEIGPDRGSRGFPLAVGIGLSEARAGDTLETATRRVEARRDANRNTPGIAA